MIAVIFEAYPAKEKWEAYLELAARLKSQLSTIAGFISIERYKSLAAPNKVLSLSFWEDEKSITQWRNSELHRKAQQAGRDTLFDNYRIRIAYVMRDYGMTDRQQAPNDSQLIHQSFINL